MSPTLDGNIREPMDLLKAEIVIICALYHSAIAGPKVNSDDMQGIILP
jgi:hypothetical protein